MNFDVSVIWKKLQALNTEKTFKNFSANKLLKRLNRFSFSPSLLLSRQTNWYIYEAVQLAVSYFPLCNDLFVQVMSGSPEISHVPFCGSDKCHGFNSCKETIVRLLRGNFLTQRGLNVLTTNEITDDRMGLPHHAKISPKM